MERVYHKWYSPVLERDMELLVFGHSGIPVLFFPHDLHDFTILKTGKSLML
ncbi:hypothetical protein [Dyadobacter sp. NIV53]|uniref:hypothetical protein n=1 Tax=Dyadobacter sp. NIV53 TaxID=2861765 RepID=UPI001E3F44A5|nr:hypothetical protein [Dyadobacter sp. NIV53]